jgi:DNA-binding LacI/PurR family transcriptional regulator
VAVRAGCDPRTVRAYLDGRPQHSTTASRIERAIRELNVTPPPAKVAT